MGTTQNCFHVTKGFGFARFIKKDVERILTGTKRKSRWSSSRFNKLKSGKYKEAYIGIVNNLGIAL